MRAYTNVLDRVAAELDPDRPLAAVADDEIATVLEELWGLGGCGDLEPQPRGR